MRHRLVALVLNPVTVNGLLGAAIALGVRSVVHGNTFGLVFVIACSVCFGLNLGLLHAQRILKAWRAETEHMRRIPRAVEVHEDDGGALTAFVHTLGGGVEVVRLPDGIEDDREHVLAFVAEALGFGGIVHEPPDAEA